MLGKIARWFLALIVSALLTILDADVVQSWTLDNFEDGDLVSASGLSWIVIADDLAGGTTEARLDLRPAGGGRALRLSGRLGGTGPSFAGAWATLERTGRSLDVHAFDGVRLRVKGPARLDVGFRSGVTNFMKRIEAGPDWALVEIPFSDLAPAGSAPQGPRWDPTAVQVFGVTTPQTPTPDAASGAFAFEIDDVAFYASGDRPMQPAATGPSAGMTVIGWSPPSSIPVSGWSDSGSDPERDGKFPSLPDATRLETIASGPDGMLWARVTLRERPHGRWIGMNLAIDTDDDPANGFAWWGSNNGFKFDQLVTVWCFRVAAGCQGYVGLADAAQAAAQTFVAGGGEKLRIAIDYERPAFIVGVPRELLKIRGGQIRLVAAVGSALLYADDVPGQGAATIR